MGPFVIGLLLLMVKSPQTTCALGQVTISGVREPAVICPLALPPKPPTAKRGAGKPPAPKAPGTDL